MGAVVGHLCSPVRKKTLCLHLSVERAVRAPGRLASERDPMQSRTRGADQDHFAHGAIVHQGHR